MKPISTKKMLLALACVSVGIVPYLLFVRTRGHDLSWIFLVVCCTAMTTSIGVLFEDVWPSAVVGLLIGLWIVILTYFV